MKKVLYARTFETTFVKGMPPLPKTLDPAEIRDLAMTLVRPGVLCEIKGRVFILPYHRFETIEVDPESLKEKGDE